MRSVLAILALAIAMHVGGCAALLVEGPPAQRDPRVQPTCTTSKGWVYVDDLLGIADVVSFWVYDDIEQETGIDQSAGKIGAVVGAVVHGVSSLIGEQRVRACRKAHAEYEANVIAGLPAQDVHVPRRPYWCTSSEDELAVGACNKERAVCETSRRRMVGAGNDMGACERKVFVDCFVVVREGMRKVGCAPTLDACVRMRQRRIMEADGAIEISECAPSDERRPVVVIEAIERPPSPPVEVTEVPAAPPEPRHCVAIDGQERCFVSAEACGEGRAAAIPMYSLGVCAPEEALP